MPSISVKEELKAIQKSIKELTPQEDEIKTVTASGEGSEYKEYKGLSGTGDSDLSIYKNYAQMLDEATLAKAELNFERKINTVQRELLSEINRVGGEVKSNRPNYKVFITVFVATALMIAAIFVPIIPIYTDNIVTKQNVELKKSILSELKEYIDKKIDGFQKKPK